MGAAKALVAERLAVAEYLLRAYVMEHPTDVAAIRMLAEIGTRLGRYADAEALLTRCLDLAPSFISARHNYAIVLYRQNRGMSLELFVKYLLDERGQINRYTPRTVSVCAAVAPGRWRFMSCRPTALNWRALRQGLLGTTRQTKDLPSASIFPIAGAMSLSAFPVHSSDVVVIGAGAAGLMCAIEAGRRGRRVRVIDHSAKPAEKIRISGGGRCNFTNLNATPANFISRNPQFCVSALKRFSQHDFIARVATYGIAFHEKTLGQLFCDGPSSQIIAMLLEDLFAAGGELELGVEPGEIVRTVDGFRVETSSGPIACTSVVVATGGKSIPKMGASSYGYEIARAFGLKLIEPTAALVPFTFIDPELAPIEALAGVSVSASIACGSVSFAEGLLFTHRGLSGPAALQVSSYWHAGETLTVDLAYGCDAYRDLRTERADRPKLTLPTALARLLPKRLAGQLATRTFGEARLADLSDTKLRTVADAVHAWRVTPNGTEGWRTAEVTLGGVDTDGLSSQTMMAKTIPGLYFIGECVDVTGWLGGYNFQWAWSSGWAAGQAA